MPARTRFFAPHARAVACWLSAALVVWPMALRAQEAGAVVGAPGEPAAGVGRLSTSLGSTLLVSDNLVGARSVVAGAPFQQDGGALLTVSPGIVYRRDAEGLRLNLDYRLNLQESWRLMQGPRAATNNLQSSLNWQSDNEAFRLQASAGIGQQRQSAFGVQRVDDRGLGLGNQGELYQLSLSPSATLRLGGVARAEFSHRASVSNQKNSVLGDTRSHSTEVAVRTEGGRSTVGLVLSSARSDPKQGLASRTERALVDTRWKPDVDWQFGAYAGRERSNVAAFGTTLGAGTATSTVLRSGSTVGGSVLWSPGPRTRVSLQADDRVFGRTYAWSAEHRLARSSVRFGQSRSLTEPGLVGGAGSGTQYDLLFTQYASVEPDPVKRDALVRQTLDQQGLALDAPARTGLLSNRSTLSQQSSLGASWQTQRTTWLASVTRTHSRALATNVPAGSVPDDFTLSNQVLQSSASLSTAYRLTPSSGLNAVVTWQRSQGDLAGLSTDLKSLTLGWSVRLGARQTLSLNARHARFSSARFPYDENAVQFSFQQQF